MGGSRYEYGKFSATKKSSKAKSLETLVKGKRRNRRSLRKNKPKSFKKKFTLIGVNSAGISAKLDSLDYLSKEIQPTVFFIQETKLRTQGRIKTENSGDYQIFELLRKNLGGGGLAIGAKHDVEPVWLGEGEDQVEILVVQVKIGDIMIRCFDANGPQEKHPGISEQMSRKTSRGFEDSFLDLFVVCNEISRFSVKRIVDEEKQFVISRYVTKKGVKITSTKSVPSCIV